MVYKSSKLGAGGSGGTVTQVNTGTGLTGGPITSSGTISVADSTDNSLAGYDNTGEFATVAVGTGLSLSAGTLTATGGGGSSAFSALTSGTNTTAAMVIGTGASLAASGSGTIVATSATGNAATATVLATPRAINGVNFDGGAPITVTAAAGTLTGTTLASNVVNSSITSVGAGINLGTPSALVGTNITGTASGLTAGSAAAAPASGITGLATGILTWLTTPSSANLAAALTDETGSGPAVFGIGPTLNAPILLHAYVAKTATYAILSTDETIECTSGTFTLTLPTTVGVKGQDYTIINSGTGIITLATTSSQTISGQLTQVLSGQWKTMTVRSNGTNWIII